MLHWDIRFLQLARLISTYSKDPSTRVGAVAVSPDRTDICLGYNGLPRKLKDREEILNNRDEKYKRILHAEQNLILLAKRDLTNYTLYTFPFMCCSNCASMVVQAGFTRVVSLECDIERWRDSFQTAKETFMDAKVRLDLYPVKYMEKLV